MASGESPHERGSRVTEAAKLCMATSEKGGRGGVDALQHAGGANSRANAATGTPGAEQPRSPSISPELADQIGARLRSVYDGVLAQPVPERFMELLRQLESGPATSLAPAKKTGR
jgi:hypothetical protein